MNLLATIDAAVLRAADGLVLGAWNMFSVPRIVLIRSAFVVWVVGRGTLALAGGAVTAWTALWLLGMLFIGVVEEVSAARNTPRAQNARALATRTEPFGLVIRWLALSAPIKVYGEYTVLDIAASIAVAAYFILTQSLTPEDPPKRPKRQAVLKSVRAPV